MAKETNAGIFSNARAVLWRITVQPEDVAKISKMATPGGWIFWRLVHLVTKPKSVHLQRVNGFLLEINPVSDHLRAYKISRDNPEF